MTTDPHPPAAVVTRFAPSPTGELHIGGARTALYAWAFAHRHPGGTSGGTSGGKFLLRFEDTDRARSSDASAQRILDDLQWLGLNWDNTDIPKQSERLDRYNAIIQQLFDQGDAYEDQDAIRFRMGTHRGDITFDDAVYGTIQTPAADLEDFIIRKGAAGEFMPTFHLAVVVDDHDFHVTHVIRGQEHLSNTPKHAALCDALNFTRPVWAHTPSIMNPGGSKMSKRDKAKLARAETKAQGWPCPDGIDPKRFDAFMAKENHDNDIAHALAKTHHLQLPEIDVADFRNAGYLPAALLNYVALLGWNPGNDRENFDLDFMAQHFDLGRINKANSTFDRAKLASFNQDAILAMPLKTWEKHLRNHFTDHHPDFLEKLKETSGETSGGDGFSIFAAAYQERSKTLSDPATLGRFFIEPPADYNPKAVKKNLLNNEGQGLHVLAALREKLDACDPWDAPTLRALIENLWPQLGCKNMGGLAQPLRVALTGNAVSPEIDATLALLGKTQTLARIDACLITLTP